MVNKIFLLFIISSIMIIGLASAQPYITISPTPTITHIPNTNFGAPFKNMTQSIDI
jgi:hypothetical protein